MTTALSVADQARIMLNTPETANRFVVLNGVEYPILHLGIGDVALFKAAFEPLDKLYRAFVQSQLPIVDFLLSYKGDLNFVFSEAVPRVAGIVLRLSPKQATGLGSPLELLNLVIAQWTHNLEIIKIRELYPHPDEDDDYDESDSNPVSLVERLMAAYHGMTYEGALRHSIPQVYLMGQSSAVAYARMEEESESNTKSNGKRRATPKKKKGIMFEGKYWPNPKSMGAARYRRYLGGAVENAYSGKTGKGRAIN
jgi:hypothetical protein